MSTRICVESPSNGEAKYSEPTFLPKPVTSPRSSRTSFSLQPCATQRKPVVNLTMILRAARSTSFISARKWFSSSIGKRQIVPYRSLDSMFWIPGTSQGQSSVDESGALIFIVVSVCLGEHSSATVTVGGLSRFTASTSTAVDTITLKEWHSTPLESRGKMSVPENPFASKVSSQPAVATNGAKSPFLLNRSAHPWVLYSCILGRQVSGLPRFQTRRPKVRMPCHSNRCPRISSFRPFQHTPFMSVCSTSEA